MILQFFAVIAIFIILWFAIGFIPDPTSKTTPPRTFPLRSILYIADCLFAAAMIAHIAGWI